MLQSKPHHVGDLPVFSKEYTGQAQTLYSMYSGKAQPKGKKNTPHPKEYNSQPAAKETPKGRTHSKEDFRDSKPRRLLEDRQLHLPRERLPWELRLLQPGWAQA